MNGKCANCGIDIRWHPTIVNGKTYCCIGCSQGGPCTCDYEHLPSPDEKADLVQTSSPISPPAVSRHKAGASTRRDAQRENGGPHE